jgi:large subunit ribosomal protein L24
MKVKKGDNIIVIAGKDKGKKGKVARALPKAEKVIVEGVNMYKKHRKPKTTNEKGSANEVPMPIHVSNVRKLD